MNRRAFLQFTSAVSLAGIVAIVCPSQAASVALPSPASPVLGQAAGKMFRVANNSQLFVSTDFGKTWDLYADFGASTILSIRELQQKLYLELSFNHYNFYLQSTDGKVWRTVEALPEA